ncbi:MAG: putative ubiquitin-RnfH superfamily antitoxin RatB of RatAB toxin-antitoxin module [Hydrogenophaga sp.]|jgi:putative ubiquitin-RnfH superfamily antitoxin RatB of RatAB toxin-antitoxin module
MNIELAYASAPRTVHTLALVVPEACTLDQALAASGWLQDFPELATLPAGIWSLKAARDALLREGDRVEFYRALRVDPKVARRERFVGQGSRGTGLFSRRRPGAKPGY